MMSVSICVFAKGDDWAQFDKYKLDNDSIIKGRRPKVVFMGNSITEGWMKEDPEFFIANNFVGRGISGQTSYQMLVRFREDVINLKPEIVVINAGTNDIAENNHPYNENITFGNLISMVELAQANGIKVILTSILPTDKFYWNPSETEIPNKINSLNSRIKNYADERGLPYADYYSKMVGDGGALKKEYSTDGVHPVLLGYKVMEQVIEPVINNF